MLGPSTTTHSDQTSTGEQSQCAGGFGDDIIFHILECCISLGFGYTNTKDNKQRITGVDARLIRNDVKLKHVDAIAWCKQIARVSIETFIQRPDIVTVPTTCVLLA